MTSPLVTNLEKLIGTPRDGALLRYSLGNEYLKQGDAGKGVEYLRQAVDRDPGYSAAWRALGKALEAAGRDDEALEAYRAGIAAAEKKGDKQAGKEMAVFARRIENRRSG